MMQSIDDVSVFGPSGEIDTEEGRRLLAQIGELVRPRKGRSSQGETCKIVLDLKNVEHVHYKILSDLMILSRLTALTTGGIKLANLTPYTQKLLRITGVDQYFETYESVADAVLSFDRASDVRFEMH
jgi:anti-anti-sigma regulatory factor